MTLIIELSDERQAVLAAKAQERGISAEQFAQQLLEQAIGSPTTRPLSARIREMWNDMPEDVAAKLPTDGASQHDHYIYGTPKRPL